jgi:hypothetical protein
MQTETSIFASIHLEQIKGIAKASLPQNKEIWQMEEQKNEERKREK